MKARDRRPLYIGLLCAFLLAGCAPFGAPTRTPTAAPFATEPTTLAVSVRLSEATTTRVQAELAVGTTARMEAFFEPVLHGISRGSDGTVQGSSMRFLEDHNVAEMQVCTSMDTPCQLQDEWVPFAAEQVFEMPVDWLGAREIWLTASFRDAQGTVVPAVGGDYEDAKPVAHASYTIVGIVEEDAPVDGLPAHVQTAAVATREAFPVRGSVLIEDGGCCAGGTAGDTIQVDVAFEATSPEAPVHEIRVRTGDTCFTEEEMAQAEWEALLPESTYPVHVAINWIGFYVTAQYRDAQGNLSPAYCDDISIEGHAPPP